MAVRKVVEPKVPKKILIKVPYGNAKTGDLVSVDGVEYSLVEVNGDGSRRVLELEKK